MNRCCTCLTCPLYLCFARTWPLHVPTYSGPFSVINARYYVAAFPVNSSQYQSWSVQCPCGERFSTDPEYSPNGSGDGVLTANTTMTSVTLPTVAGVTYHVVVSATCTPEDYCAPGIVYGQTASARLVYIVGGGECAVSRCGFCGCVL